MCVSVGVCVCVCACLLLCVHTCMCASAYASGGQLSVFRVIPQVSFTLLYETVSLVDLEPIKWTRLMGQKSTAYFCLPRTGLIRFLYSYQHLQDEARTSLTITPALKHFFVYVEGFICELLALLTNLECFV